MLYRRHCVLYTDPGQPAGLCTDLCDRKPDVVFYLSFRDRPGTSRPSGAVYPCSAHSVRLLPADEQKKCSGEVAFALKVYPKGYKEQSEYKNIPFRCYF